LHRINEIRLRNITFSSYCRLSIIMWGSVGVICGILAFIISLFGADVKASVGTTEYHGITAGIISLILAPIVCIIVGLIFSTLAYFPFKLGYKVLKGVNIKGDFEHLNELETTIDERDNLIKGLTYLNKRYNSAVRDAIEFIKEQGDNISGNENLYLKYTRKCNRD
jgi:hypothetical protein